jgi:hypothetical protein
VVGFSECPKLSDQERKNVIQKAAFDLGLRFDVVEKDIWVEKV